MSLLREIKRRKMIRVAAVYAVAGWLLVQVIPILEAPLKLPAWTDTAVIVLLSLGFPIVLGLSWFFDLTAEGIVRDQAAPEVIDDIDWQETTWAHRRIRRFRRQVDLTHNIRQFLNPLVVWLFSIWSRIHFDIRLGHSLGALGAQESLRELDLSKAFPNQLPDTDLVDERIVDEAYVDIPTARFRSANAWAAALQTNVLRNKDRYAQPGAVLTTYGFAHVDCQVRLCVIQYLTVWQAFRARKIRPIQLGEHTFPVFIRPWLATRHGSRRIGDGSCWITFKDDIGLRRKALLTAHHAVRPKGAAIGDEVGVDVRRRTPRGHLRRMSHVMDAMVIEISEMDWGAREPTPNSGVVGYKPVRFITGGEPVDAEVIEHSGYAFRTFPVPAEPDVEPHRAVQLIFNRALQKGDSGCLVVDLEYTDDVHGPRPYALYLGEENLNIAGGRGYGLLLEQPKRIWDLDFFF